MGAAVVMAAGTILAGRNAVVAGARSVPVGSGQAARCAQAPGGGLTLANVGADGSRVVAVGSDGLIATSSTPSRWVVRRTPIRHALRGAVWTGRRWIVVGDAGTILSSADGRVWRAARGIPNVGLRAVASRSGLVIAAGSGGRSCPPRMV